MEMLHTNICGCTVPVLYTGDNVIGMLKYVGSSPTVRTGFEFSSMA